MEWQKYNGESIRCSLLESVEKTILQEQENGNQLKIFIGTDSQVKRNIVEFATAIVFIREHKGGFMFVRKEKTHLKLSIKERMLSEVQKSIEVAYLLCPLLDLYNVELEVHADINTNPSFKSNTALHEAMGYIIGMGFAFRAKPDSFASTTCANRIVQ